MKSFQLLSLCLGKIKLYFAALLWDSNILPECVKPDSKYYVLMSVFAWFRNKTPQHILYFILYRLHQKYSCAIYCLQVVSVIPVQSYSRQSRIRTYNLQKFIFPMSHETETFSVILGLYCYVTKSVINYFFKLPFYCQSFSHCK